MACIINADNGAISGSAGVKTTADSTGVLNIQTNGTTAISISASQAVSFTNTPTFTGGTANGVLYLNGSKVATSGTALVFDGTNLGIGTSSPGAKLEVNAGANTEIRVNTSGSGYLQLGQFTNGAFIGTSSSDATAGVLRLGTGGSERARIDTSGNLGIGTSSPAYPLQVRRPGGACSLGLTMDNYGSIAELARSIFYYAIGDLTSDRTGHLFFTRNATSTDNLRLVINSAGNVGIGTASPVNKLGLSPTTANNSERVINIYSGSNVAQAYVSIGSQYATDNANVNSEIRFGNEQTTGAPSYLAFATGTSTSSTERARITSGGKFLLNTTSTVVSGDEICGMIGTSGIGVKCTGGSSNFAAGFWNDATSGDNNLALFYTETGGTQRGSITYNRGAGQVAYNVTSDVRLKNNIADAVDAGSKVDALKVRQFDWKETGNHVDYGFVAQELDAIAPQAVSKPEDEEAMWSVDYSKLVPMLVKEIQSLRARVAQLETK
jgi:hypothetical protein